MVARRLSVETADRNGRNGGMHVVGPAARLDKEEAERSGEEYRAWADMRGVIVDLRKRMGIQETDWSCVSEYQTLSQRTALEKRANEPLSAPASSGDNEDLKALGRTDFLDDALQPPFDFEVLCRLHENSSALRQNVDAFATNVDGFGHRFNPVLDFDSPDINETIRDLMIRHRLDEKIEATEAEAIENGKEPVEFDLMSLTAENFEELTPGEEEVEAQKKLWQQIATIEKARVQSFFEFVNPIESFTEVRVANRETREILGNSAWEVIREDPANVNSKVCQVYNVPFLNVRLMRKDATPVTVKMKVRKDAIHFDEIEVDRFFRRYVRMVGDLKTYYKEFGDPRVLSRDTGKFFPSVEALQVAEGKEDEDDPKVVKPANELYHWKVRSQVSVYGIPRWMGALLSVMGSRAAEEVNFLYFDNKAIPPMALLVSGGRVSEDCVAKLESYIEDRIKGRSNFWKIMLIEAVGQEHDESSGDLEHSGKLRIELKPLMSAQMQDGLFQQYDQNNILKIGRSFRQPQLLTGDTADMNRSTADVAKAFAEEQVYQPERVAFDEVMDRHFLVNLGIHFWRFVTNAPVQRIPNDLVENAKKALESGAMVPNEARKLLEDAFSMDLGYRDEEWADLPPKIAVALARQGQVSSDSGESAADQVESAEGQTISRGKTGLGGGTPHTHDFVAVRDNGQVRIVVLPGGEDGHSHDAESVRFDQGKAVEIQVSEVTTEGEDSPHGHEIAFTFPISKRRRTAMGAISLIASLRELVEEEISEGMDEFFKGQARIDSE